MSREANYFLGTHDDEVARLELQHRVWRPRALDAWRRAGFAPGQTLLDIGCGPGHASVDLAEIVGPTGRIVGIDRSRRFLDALGATAAERGLKNITALEFDLNDAELPQLSADGAWCRWVLAFVKRPRDLLARLTAALKPGAALVLHEYFDYSTWRLAPRCREIKEFVSAVMETWRADGGEPDIGLDLPLWLDELGFEIKACEPIIDLVPASNPVWQWLEVFIQLHLGRLVEMGRLTDDRAITISQAFAASKIAARTLMITPAVLEIVAIRPPAK